MQLTGTPSTGNLENKMLWGFLLRCQLCHTTGAKDGGCASPLLKPSSRQNVRTANPCM
jgi:hypothetical protein